MEVFDPSIVLNPASFRQDRINLLVGDWQIEGQQHNLTEFYNRISSSAGRSDPPLNELGRIFNRPEGGVNNPYRFSIRSRSSGIDGHPPLFSGFLRVKNGRRTSRLGATAEVRKLLELNLSLNTTRFANYQRVLANRHDDPDQWTPDVNMRHERLQEYRNVRDRMRRLAHPRNDTLDGSDNILLRHHLSLLGDASWSVLIETYLSEVIDVISDEFERAARLSNVSCIHYTTRRGQSLNSDELLLTLSECESYIEFLPPPKQNAIELVDSLFPYLTQYRKHRLDQYDVNFNTSESLDCSKSITLWIDEGIKLKIYAKTLKRVRFEVRFSLTNCSEILHDDRSRRRTTQDEEELLHWILSLNHEAADVLQRLFDFLSDRMDCQNETSPYMLPLRIGQIISNESIAEGITTALIRNGSITLRRTGDRYRTSVRKLVGEGILELVEGDANSCRTYSVTSAYQESLSFFTD